MSADQPDWMDAENNRADDLADTGMMENPSAAKLVRVNREPPRFQKNLYLQKEIIDAFDQLVLQQKMIKGKKAPELAEEAIQLLLMKYGG